MILNPDDPQTGALLANTQDDLGRLILLRGAHIVRMDETEKDLPAGDLLIEGDRIAAIGRDLSTLVGEATLTIDMSGYIICPGLIDSHIHAWEAALRGISPAAGMGDYLAVAHLGLAPLFTPEDMFAGEQLAAIHALNGGVTTIVDNSHNSRTPEHSDAVIDAVESTGIRAAHAAGKALTGTSEEQFRKGLLRLRDRRFSSSDELLTIRVFGANPTVEFMTFARDNELGVSAELVGGHALPEAGVPAADVAIFEAGLIDSNHTFNHCVGLDDLIWRAIRDHGAAVNMTPRSDPHFGIGTGFPGVMDAQRFGMQFGISSDNELSYGIDLFTEMRVLMTHQRGKAHAHNVGGDGTAPVQLFQPRDVLAAATLGGARNAGLEGRVGALAVDMKADLIGVKLDKLHLQPWGTAIGTIVNFAQPSDVDMVVVNGSVRKWEGALLGVDVDAILARAWASRERLLAAAGIDLDSDGSGIMADDVLALMTSG